MTATQRAAAALKNQNRQKSKTDKNSKQSNLLSICDRTSSQGAGEPRNSESTVGTTTLHMLHTEKRRSKINIYSFHNINQCHTYVILNLSNL